MNGLRSTVSAACLAVLACAVAGCPPQPLGVLEVTPNLSLYRVEGDTVVGVLFNQTLDASTVDETTFYVTRGEDAGDPRVPGSLSVGPVKVTFTPDEPFAFGVRHRVWIAPGLMSAAGTAFDGAFPAVTYGATGVEAPGDVFAVTLPDDVDDGDVGSYDLLGYNPVNPLNYDPAVPEKCPGISATEAWKFTTGRPDVLVTVIDNGLGSYANPELQRSLFLNRAELPLPRDSQGHGVCDLGACDDPYDWNRDGRFNVFDYADAGFALGPGGALAPVADGNANGRIDVEDLFAAYVDGADGYGGDPDSPGDPNAFADDISGYDFMRKAPVALGMDDFPEGTHGEGRAEEIAAEADNGSGTPGVCPDCSVLVLRVTYALIEEGELVSQAVRYALDMGTDAIVAALGALNGTSEEAAAIDEAAAAGVLVLTGPGDESSFHHSVPSIMNHLYTVKANFGFFLESFCTGYGGQIHTAAVGQCGSTASGRSAGAVGLVLSRARELGYCSASDPGSPDCTQPDLTGNEVKQVLSATAEKPSVASACGGLITDAPCKLDTWDSHQGYGRLNLFRAMMALEEGAIPPAVEILRPHWFRYFDLPGTPVLNLEGTVAARAPVDGLVCEAAVGLEPDEADFSAFACALDGGGNLTGALSLSDVAAAMGGVSGPPDGPEARTFTVRVRATAGGVTGEDRRVFAVHADPDLVAGFPVSLVDLDDDGVEDVAAEGRNAPSIEGSPALADLDGDGADELILVTSNSFLHALRYDAGLQAPEEVSGYPVPIRRAPGMNDGIAAAPAVDDLDLDGRPDIVVATLNGYVFAFRGEDGTPLAGPGGLIGQADAPANGSPEAYGAGTVFFSGPVLADLDDDGYLDVVLGCSDQKVYAFSGSSVAAGAPARLPGWPVTAADPAHCFTLAASVLGTVAAVDITEDGVPEIIAGTSETCGTPVENSGRLYAIHPDGNLNPGGPFVAGFPVGVEPNALGIDIPLPPLTTGLPGAPVAARSGSDVVIGTGAFFGPITHVRVTPLTGSVAVEKLPAVLQFGAGGTGAFGTDALGDRVYAVGTATLGPASGHGAAQMMHNTLTWRLDDTGTPEICPNDDLTLLSSPSFADVDGDGAPELITVSGGHLVHAFVDPETEAAGWPKFTYGWHMASPALGDLDGDGLLELVAPVREGRVFAWHTQAPLCGNHPWPTYHHDNRRTGNLDQAVPDPRCP